MRRAGAYTFSNERRRSNAPSAGHVPHLRVQWVNPAGGTRVLRYPILIQAGKMSDTRWWPHETTATHWQHALEILRRHEPSEAWLHHVDANDLKLTTPFGYAINESTDRLYRDLADNKLIREYDHAPAGNPVEEARDGFETRNVRIVMSVHD
jgi:hypothetical protein